MTAPTRILLQATTSAADNDWTIDRFSLVRKALEAQTDKDGMPLYDVLARNRLGPGSDPVLSTLDRSKFDELWLFAVDDGDGLPASDCEGITRFWQRGGGLLTTRDHQDVGVSIRNLGRIGHAHFFHSINREPDASRHEADDAATKSISWPNYHSGRNGDFQSILVVEPLHELLRNPTSVSGVVEYFPAHPHEGAVGAPAGERSARVIAMGRSLATGRTFNLAVAFERESDEYDTGCGRAVADSNFHHFADYNWDVTSGCPTFVDETPGDDVLRNPARLDDIRTYVRNLAAWLKPRTNRRQVAGATPAIR
ncbi:MAG: hypothetical protein C5B46_09995 [Proteobacteria bacterium]|nr:MAG: hypothetical protein C5B46_09995 [Pseudomonadota bacterium]